MELFGDRDKEATTKEFQQIHDFGTYVPVMQKDLTRGEKSRRCMRLCSLWRNVTEELRRGKSPLVANNVRSRDM